MRLDIYSHGFSASEIEPRSWPALNRMCRFMGHYEREPDSNGRYHEVQKSTYGGAFSDRSRFYFHNSVLDKFIALVKDVNPDAIIVEHVHALYETEHVEIIRKDHRPPRNGQENAIRFIVENGDLKVICVEPGGGKTYILNQALVDVNRRMGMVIKAQYLPKWEADISEAHHVEEGDILIIQGSVELIKAQHDALAGRLKANALQVREDVLRSPKHSRRVGTSHRTA